MNETLFLQRSDRVEWHGIDVDEIGVLVFGRLVDAEDARGEDFVPNIIVVKHWLGCPKPVFQTNIEIEKDINRNYNAYHVR